MRVAADMTHKKIALWVLLGIVGLSMLTGIAAVVMPRGMVDERVLISIFIMGPYALGGLVIVAVARGMIWTLRGCAFFVMLSMVLFLMLIWVDGLMDWEWMDHLGRFAGANLIIGVVLTHRLMICPLNVTVPIAKVSKRIALISSGITGGVFCVLLLADGFFHADELIVKLLAVGSILAAGSTIATCTLVLFGSKPEDDEPRMMASSVDVSLQCPVCEHELQIKSNIDGCCSYCNLKIRVNAEEMYCECGYLLYKLEGEVCPECGKGIEAGERWGSRDEHH